MLSECVLQYCEMVLVQHLLEVKASTAVSVCGVELQFKAFHLLNG